jgi:hypothetical protein
MPGQNRTADPPAHVWCAVANGRLMAPEPRPAVSRYVSRLLRAFGSGGAVTWHPEHDSGEAAPPRRDPEIEHSERALSPSRAYSDRPGYVPWLVVAQTPCPDDDLGGWAAQTRPGAVPGSYLCRLRHAHHGPSPYGRPDIPEEVRRRISASLGEETPVE